MSLVSQLELALAEARRAEGPGVAKARAEDAETIRWRGQAHAKLVHSVSQLKRWGLSQAEIARRMHISDTHLCKLLSDGMSHTCKVQGEHIEALSEIIARAAAEALNCG
jgi:predicted XRE-type DNA-binding protein